MAPRIPPFGRRPTTAGYRSRIGGAEAPPRLWRRSENADGPPGRRPVRSTRSRSVSSDARLAAREPVHLAGAARLAVHAGGAGRRRAVLAAGDRLAARRGAV